MNILSNVIYWLKRNDNSDSNHVLIYGIKDNYGRQIFLSGFDVNERWIFFD